VKRNVVDGNVLSITVVSTDVYIIVAQVVRGVVLLDVVLEKTAMDGPCDGVKVNVWHLVAVTVMVRDVEMVVTLGIVLVWLIGCDETEEGLGVDTAAWVSPIDTTVFRQPARGAPPSWGSISDEFSTNSTSASGMLVLLSTLSKG